MIHHIQSAKNKTEAEQRFLYYRLMITLEQLGMMSFTLLIDRMLEKKIDARILTARWEK